MSKKTDCQFFIFWGSLDTGGSSTNRETNCRFDESGLVFDRRSLSALSMSLQVKLHQQKALAQHSVATLTEALHLLPSAKNHHRQHHHHHHHHQHHTASSVSGPFHLALEDSVTSFWQPGSPELSALAVHRLSSVEDLRRLEGEGPVGLVVDITCPRWLGEEEVRCQARLLDVLLDVCSVSTSL